MADMRHLRTRAMKWNPHSSESWATLLGLVNVPLYGRQLAGGPNASILLDGQRGTFAFFEASPDGPPINEKILSQAWSANALHVLAIGLNENVVHVHRWDSDSLIPRKLKLPRNGLAAEEMFAALEAAPKARAASAVQHVLSGFRLIRAALPDGGALQAVQMLNGFLLAVALARDNEGIRAQFEQARVFADVVNLLGNEYRQFIGVEADEAPARGHPVGAIPAHFLNPESRTGCELDPVLLFRHASTELYQEAHLEIERDPQSYLVGLAPIDRPRGVGPRDVRLTPANLARVLVEQAIDAFGTLPDELVVLDPSCGSGVFLQQCLRELASTSYRGNVSIHGYDISTISTCISQFCLNGPVRDALSPGLEANVQILNVNSLATDWVPAHLILMNPPFISRDHLTPEQLASVYAALGNDLAQGRVDMAMAFVWKAVQSLREGGVLATVLPTGLLENDWGTAWREAIAEVCDIYLLGRFEGYKYFTTSMVETAFAVLRKRISGAVDRPPRVSVLVAKEGSEDAAIRCLRRNRRGEKLQVKGVDFYEASIDKLRNGRWTPLRRSQYSLRAWSEQSDLPTLGSLFRVHQGIRTRHKPAFVLSVDEYNNLPDIERPYFRPAAGQTTIADGRLFAREYVFYPYDEAGLKIETEAELEKRVPTFLGTHLCRFRSMLQDEQWWALFRPRKWQWSKEPKLVSKTYGKAGDFGFDQTGDYAVVQGCAWQWKESTSGEFLARRLQLAYLALLNSNVFETLLSVFCRRVQGGQFEISKKYVMSIPIPDLTRDDSTTASHVEELADTGEIIHDRGLSCVGDDIGRIVIKTYALPDEIATEFLRSTEETRAHRK